MNDEIPIPPEVRSAATNALLQTGGDVVAAIRAALAAWPGMRIKTAVKDMRQHDTAIILPLSEEPRT
jgi:hypothetical protein